MSEMMVIKAVSRQERGSRAARRIRAEGRVPAVLYGHHEEVLSLSVDGGEIDHVVKTHAHALLELHVDGTPESAIIKDCQFDFLGREILHVDFARVSKDERIKMDVQVVIKGVAPGVAEGGVVDQHVHHLAIECPVNAITEQVVVNINHLHLDQAVLVKDLVLQEGTKVLADPDLMVVQIVKPRAMSEEPAVPAEPGAAEPEVIRREAKEEAAEDE